MSLSIKDAVSGLGELLSSPKRAILLSLLTACGPKHDVKNVMEELTGVEAAQGTEVQKASKEDMSGAEKITFETQHLLKIAQELGRNLDYDLSEGVNLATLNRAAAVCIVFAELEYELGDIPNAPDASTCFNEIFLPAAVQYRAYSGDSRSYNAAIDRVQVALDDIFNRQYRESLEIMNENKHGVVLGSKISEQSYGTAAGRAWTLETRTAQLDTMGKKKLADLNDTLNKFRGFNTVETIKLQLALNERAGLSAEERWERADRMLQQNTHSLAEEGSDPEENAAIQKLLDHYIAYTLQEIADKQAKDEKSTISNQPTTRASAEIGEEVKILAQEIDDFQPAYVSGSLGASRVQKPDLDTRNLISSMAAPHFKLFNDLVREMVVANLLVRWDERIRARALEWSNGDTSSLRATESTREDIRAAVADISEIDPAGDLFLLQATTNAQAYQPAPLLPTLAGMAKEKYGENPFQQEIFNLVVTGGGVIQMDSPTTDAKVLNDVSSGAPCYRNANSALGLVADLAQRDLLKAQIAIEVCTAISNATEIGNGKSADERWYSFPKIGDYVGVPINARAFNGTYYDLKEERVDDFLNKIAAVEVVEDPNKAERILKRVYGVKVEKDAPLSERVVTGRATTSLDDEFSRNETEEVRNPEGNLSVGDGLTGSVAEIGVSEPPLGFRTDHNYQFAALNSRLENDRIIGYEWDFGDGSPVAAYSDPTVRHTFTGPGTFTVRLTVQGATKSVTITKQITVAAAEAEDSEEATGGE